MFDKLISGIVRVIQGGYNGLFKKPNEETLRRKKICDACEFKRGKICGICYCVLSAKQASQDEKCLMNKGE